MYVSSLNSPIILMIFLRAHGAGHIIIIHCAGGHFHKFQLHLCVITYLAIIMFQYYMSISTMAVQIVSGWNYVALLSPYIVICVTEAVMYIPLTTQEIPNFLVRMCACHSCLATIWIFIKLYTHYI